MTALDEMQSAAGPQPIPRSLRAPPCPSSGAQITTASGYHDDPQDPGRDNLGRHLHNMVRLAAHARRSPDARHVPRPRAGHDLGAEALYRALFWNACQCAALPLGVGLMTFDAAVGSAPLHAARWLQSVVGVPQDGEIGPQTIAAARRMPPATVINALATTRESFYASLPTFRYYGNGWDRRAQDCRTLALSMVGKSAVTPSQSSQHAPTSAADSTESADALNASELSKLGSES